MAICARRAERLDEVAAEIKSAGGTAFPFVADVTNEGDVQALVDQTVSRFGRLDVMVCNAGFGLYGAIDTIGPDRMRGLMDVNFMGTYHAARAALPVFRQQKSGHLIIVSSIVGKRGIPYMGAYAATKFAQVGLGECLRAELIDEPIHVSVVYPISTDTEFFEVMTRLSGFATRARGPRQAAGDVADAIARALDRPVPEIYPYAKARGLALLNAVAPGFCDKVVKRWGRKPI